MACMRLFDPSPAKQVIYCTSKTNEVVSGDGGGAGKLKDKAWPMAPGAGCGNCCGGGIFCRGYVVRFTHLFV